MLSKSLIESVLTAALAGGGDLSELFFEDTRRNSLEYRDSKVQTVLSGRDYGAGIRVLNGLNYVYAYTADVSEAGLMAAARAAATAVGQQRKMREVRNLTLAPRRDLQPALILPGASHAQERVSLARAAHDAATAYSPEIVQATASLAEVCLDVIIANSDGVYVEDSRHRARFMINAAAAKGDEMQTGYQAPGRGAGFEFFRSLDVDALAKSAAETAVTMLHAPFAPAGTMPVVVGNGFGGVIFHEACGHSLESIRTGKNQSEFSGKMGQKVANSKVTAIDDGSLMGYWGSCGYDDEGTPTQRNILIDKGILTGNLVDTLGSRRMGLAKTGSGRRQSYRFAPVSRMNNTFIAPGNDTGLIETIGYGLYAKQMGGGSVDTLTGEFNFAVLEGYLIKNGKIDSPVRGATLIGKGSEIIQRIDMVSGDLAHSEGMCGAESGSIPTCVGQPMIRVSSILVGGREA